MNTLPMNPASRVFPDGDALPVSAFTAREIMATFGAIRARVSPSHRRAELLAARKASRRMVILILLQTIRGLERYLAAAKSHDDIKVHSADFLEAAADELVTLRGELTLRLATRHNAP